METTAMFRNFFESRHPQKAITISIKKPNLPAKLVYQGDESIHVYPPLPADFGVKELFHVLREHGVVRCFYMYQADYYIEVSYKADTCSFTPQEHQYIWLLLQQVYYAEIILDKNHHTEKLIEGIRTISSSLHLDELLQAIIQNAVTVIHVADGGSLFLYDQEFDRLVPKSLIGFDANQAMNLRIKSGESITGKVFEDGIYREYYSHEDFIEGLRGLSEENTQLLFTDPVLHHLRSILSVPVSIGEKRIGVMNVHSIQSEKRFLKEDLYLLQGFAAQAAIAIENATLYTELKKNLDEVTYLSEQLKEKNQFLLKRNEVHETLTQLSINNKGVQKIVLEITRMIGAPVFFFDVLESEYYPNDIKRLPFITVDEISYLFSDRQYPIFIEISKPLKETQYLYPIVVGTVLLGCLIITFSRPLSQLDHITLEQGGSVLALELVKKQTLTEIYYKRTHEYFNRLLQNQDPEYLKLIGQELGIKLSGFLVVSILEITRYEDLQKLEAIVHKLITNIKKLIETKDKLIFGFHNKIMMLISVQSDAAYHKLIRIFDSLIQEWEKSDPTPLRIGIGSYYEGIDNIAKSHEEANKSLSYLANRNKTGAQNYDAIGVNRLFLNQHPSEIEKFVNDVFQPLWSTKSSSSDLELTLLTYIELNKSAVDTAQKMHIHINTLYGRLKRIEELLQISFTDPDDLLKIQLACHLRVSFMKKQD
ncbi:helix-turn-helix domain-containing protein [Brevibacillus invocatus]|uniref:helix-turn-helix domain-containing protein n=1 Tax=Brevibacillus invocatus TaxID=173959 RepID=UPI00203ABCE0|nr:helix-turn-helix domain-containing protein [Brevibacillus invocatus]MCM3080637.1 helix-turn-helix domain-containing protein [Brevibacillus invocatus]MCM3432398.1 helix-turn-helix domain-containing protein [Brevibacillus invocatus]